MASVPVVPGRTMDFMKVLSARVVDGKLDLPDDALREGLTVTVLVPEDDQGFELTEEQKAFIQESLAQAGRGETIDGWRLLADLRPT